MSAIITRELLERYLLVAKFDDSDIDRICGLALELPVTDLLDEVASTHPRLIEETDVLISLCLCAAAEDLLDDAACGDLGEQDREMHRLCNAAERLLGRAGVDPARWIELAERGNALGTSAAAGDLESPARGATVPTPPATEQASVRDDEAVPALLPASSGAPASPGAAGWARHGGEPAGGTVSKTPEEIAAEMVPEPRRVSDVGENGHVLWCASVEDIEDDVPLEPARDLRAAIGVVRIARGILARLVQRVREEPVQRAVAELLEAGRRPMPCGHKVEDLISGAGAVTKCGACLAERQSAAVTMRHRWLVFILREAGHLPTTFCGFDGEPEARRFYDEHSVQWSDSYLCKVVRGPAV